MKQSRIHGNIISRVICLAMMIVLPAWQLRGQGNVPMTVDYGTNWSPPNRVKTNDIGGSLRLPAPPQTEASKPAATGRIDNMEVLDDKYKLTKGDKVSFRIVEDDEPSLQLTVNDSGELELPYIGLYAATGKTCKELARALQGELEKDYYYHATVIVAVQQWARTQGKVYIVGPVGVPGGQDIPSDETLTLSKAILRAGGFTEYADRKKVRVTRKPVNLGEKDQVFTVDVEEVLKRGDRAADLQLQDGDLIFIPERLVHF